MDRCRASKQNAAGKTRQQITGGDRKRYVPSKAQRGKVDSRSLAERGSDMLSGGEKNALELSGLAAASAGGRRLRGSFLHPGCLHHANWIRRISRLLDPGRKGAENSREESRPAHLWRRRLGFRRRGRRTRGEKRKKEVDESAEGICSLPTCRAESRSGQGGAGDGGTYTITITKTTTAV